jgi:hypothetical protein
VDQAEPPQIVFAEPAPCTDTARAEELLRSTLAPSRAPRASWRVELRVVRDAHGVHAEGEITDEHGAPVAHRVIDGAARALVECSPFARAVGVWASLVLDAEREKAKNAEIAEGAKEAPPPAPPAAPEPVAPWPAPAAHEKPSPEAFTLLAHDDAGRTLELGAGTFLAGGTGTGVLAGPELFAVIEMGRALYLRPTLAFGRTLETLKPTSDVYGTWGIARFDACVRVPGLYMDRRGIQLDLCGGSDIGFLHFDQSEATATSGTVASQSARTIPFFAIGPSLGLRGELGGDLAVEVRGVAGLNIIRETFEDPTFGLRADPPLFGARAEVALAWRVR